ncbi:MAG: D-alanyl-D-alanine carboxypeptidase [Oscillospiraceae bacterium]|nr:D-alanyl-D-alanine carboxypeptidase [Oscillospiraceae bacterium]
MKKLLTIIISATLLSTMMTGFTVKTATLPTPETSSVSAVVIDAQTGKILYAKNAYEVRAMASLTKVMTTILTLEAGDLDRRFKVDNGAIHVEGTTMGLREDDVVTRRALCYGMMLPSGNDAANASAVSVSGSVGEFVTLMNTKARQIGMTDTQFANPHGLDQANHHSTAYDMAVLTAYALTRSDESATFREIAATQSVRTEFGNPPYRRWLSNNNKLLHMYEGCIGVKTGFTDNARRCLITAAQRDGRTLIAVTLNAPDDWNDHIKMYNYGFTKIGMLYKNYE